MPSEARVIRLRRPTRSAAATCGSRSCRNSEADLGPVGVARVEPIAGFSQFGLPHDDWGNRFPSWNTIPIRHVVLEQQALDRNPYLAETSSVASILDLADGGRIFPISPPQPRFNRESVAFFNASCGPMIERGGLLPAAYRGNAFVCEPLANLVHRRVLEPAGVTFVARRAEQGREFLASSDPAFRPVNLANGPDGALYVVDMYRELVEHPQFVPEPARGSVDFRRWHDRGRIWRIRPKAERSDTARRPHLRKADDRTLVALLGNRNAWWRTTAQRLLVERLPREPRGATVSQLLTIVRESPNTLARLHALWTLEGIGAVDPSIVRRLAGDPNPALREHALRVAAEVQPGRFGDLISTRRLDPARRRPRDPGPPPGRTGPGRSPLGGSGRAGGARSDRRPGCVRPLDAAGDPQRAGESAPGFIALCDRIAPSEGRSELLSQAAAIVGARGDPLEMATLLATIADRVHRETNRRDDPARGPGRRPGACGQAAALPGRRAAGRSEGTARTPRPALADRIDDGGFGPCPSPNAWWPSTCWRGAAPTWPRGSSPACWRPTSRGTSRWPPRGPSPGSARLRWPTRPSTAGNRWPWPRAASCSRPWPARRPWPNR